MGASGESEIIRALRALRRRAALDFGGSLAHRDIDREREGGGGGPERAGGLRGGTADIIQLTRGADLHVCWSGLASVFHVFDLFLNGRMAV